jgi:hypothetical protein
MNVNKVSRWSPFRRHGLGGRTVEVEERDDAAADANTIPVTAAKTNSKSKTWETTVERVESWPEEARPLKAHTWLTWLYAFGDLLLVLLPLYFIRKSYVVVLRCSPDFCSSWCGCSHPQWKTDSRLYIWVQGGNSYGSCKTSYAALFNGTLMYAGSYNVSHCVCCHNRKEYENDRPVPCRKRI